MRLIRLLGMAALLSLTVPGRAMPMLLSPSLLRPAPLKAIVAAGFETAPMSFPAKPRWPLGNARLWAKPAAPKLRLADWSHVFDIASLGEFDVPLRSDPAERTNILLAAGAIDNLTLASGQMFSFNDSVGERTPERGYQEGWMFDSGQIVRGTGGGICLVATGLYNAALDAGLKIEERHPHSGLVGYAPPGCDAGIAFGSEDLRFRNNTASALTIRALVQDDTVQVRIFGSTPPPSQQVSVKPFVLQTFPAPVIINFDPTLLPGQTVVDQKPRAGYAVVVQRFWLRHGRVIRRETVTRETRPPRPEILRAGPPLIPVAPDTEITLPGNGTPDA